MINKIKISNYRCFKAFCLELSEFNIIVGQNDVGKSTLLEAIDLAMTGYVNGKYIKNELSQYLFNTDVVNEYLWNIQEGKSSKPPKIEIELFLSDDNPELKGSNNSDREDSCGFSFIIELDESYTEEYSLIVNEELKTLPVEYYDIYWTSFAGTRITLRQVKSKASMIDTSRVRYRNQSDVYISRMIRDRIDMSEKIGISQAHRMMRDAFIENESIETINKRIQEESGLINEGFNVSVELSSKNAWETTLIACLNEIPLCFAGKGQQCIIEAKLALLGSASNIDILMIEEPENHLTHDNLNMLVSHIKDSCKNKQVIISTHSSFVANKLGLNNIIVLGSDGATFKLSKLSRDTFDFFQKIPGYDTLRMILSKIIVLVEGSSDELIFQKAYLKKYNKLPIENGIDIISVGTSFLRFLEIAENLGIKTFVITDNDGNIEALKKKYKKYIDGSNPSIQYIKIFYDPVVQKAKYEGFNCNTLEPCIMRKNKLDVLNDILGRSLQKVDLLRYMVNNKTESALKIFNSPIDIEYPEYITRAIDEIEHE